MTVTFGRLSVRHGEFASKRLQDWDFYWPTVKGIHAQVLMQCFCPVDVASTKFRDVPVQNYI